MAFAPLLFAVASTAMSVSAANQQAQQKAQMDAYNEQTNRSNAAQAIQQAQMDADQQARQSEKVLGGIRAAYGNAGIAQEGSAIDILAESTTNASLDNLAIKHRGDLRAAGYLAQANLDSMSEKNAISEGESKSAAAFISGASSAYGAYNRNAGGGSPGGGYSGGYSGSTMSAGTGSSISTA